MASDKMVTVDLRTDFRADDEQRTLYRAGKGVSVPQSVADQLGAPAADADADADAFDAAGANRDELVAEAERRGLDVDGSGKDGYVTAEDYRAALG